MMGWNNTAMALALFLAGCVVAPSVQAPSASRPRSAAAQGSAGDPLQAAEVLLQKQQYALAEEKLQSLMPAQAKNPQAWFDLGFAQSHQEKTQAAVAAYQKGVELAPDWFEANMNLGLELIKSGHAAEAIPALQRAVTLKPASGGKQAVAHAWQALGQALEPSDPHGAAGAYDKAAELNPADTEPAVRAGYILQQLGDAAAAEQRYKQAAAAGNAAGMARLIALLSAQQRYADASAWLDKYIAQNPQDAKARVQLAQLLAAQGKNQDAISILEAAKAGASDPGISRMLAALYRDGKQYDKAAGILQELAQTNPNDAQLHWDLGSALLHQHKYPEAEKEMLAALEINPRLNEDPWELAYAAQQNQHYDLAIRVLDFRSQLRRETPTTYWLRAVSYDSLGAVKPAAANYRLFLAADKGKSPDQDFKARHRLKAIEPQ